MEKRRLHWLSTVQDRASRMIQPALDPRATKSAMTSAVKQLHDLTSENMAIIERNAEARRKHGVHLPQIACRKGCDFCCFLRVRVSIPELLNIADYVAANFAGEEIDALKGRIQDHLDGLRGLDATQRLNKMLPCPLLVDHVCTVHAVRPIPCRAHHSVDVEACKQAMIHPDKVRVPHFLEVDTVVAPISQGIESAIQKRGLKGSGVLLAAGLKIALDEPEARNKWLDGDDLLLPFDVTGALP